MNTTDIQILDSEYLLDTSYAEYIKNYLSEFYPKTLLKLTIDSTIDQFVIEIAEKASDEYNTQFDAMDNSSLEKRNVNHILAKEYANALIIELINQKLV